MTIKLFVSFLDGSSMMRTFEGYNSDSLSSNVSSILIDEFPFHKGFDFEEMADDATTDDTYRRYMDSWTGAIYTFVRV